MKLNKLVDIYEEPMVSKYVYGTRTKKWHIVDETDRDYYHGLTFSEIKKLGQKDKKNLASNFGYLLLLQIATYLVPLITIPLLNRILGVEKFGLIAFSQAFIQYFIIISDYGFELSASRQVSINRDNKDKLSEIFCSVLIL